MVESPPPTHMKMPVDHPTTSDVYRAQLEKPRRLNVVASSAEESVTERINSWLASNQPDSSMRACESFSTVDLNHVLATLVSARNPYFEDISEPVGEGAVVPLSGGENAQLLSIYETYGVLTFCSFPYIVALQHHVLHASPFSWQRLPFPQQTPLMMSQHADAGETTKTTDATIMIQRATDIVFVHDCRVLVVALQGGAMQRIFFLHEDFIFFYVCDIEK